MKLPWKREPSPIEQRMAEIAELWALEEVGSQEWYRYQELYSELDERRLEDLKVRKEGAITPQAILSTATTIGLCILTLNFERFDVLRSKASVLWLRRPKS